MEGEAGVSPSIAQEACPFLASSDRTQMGLLVRGTRPWSRPICVLYGLAGHTYGDALASTALGSRGGSRQVAHPCNRRGPVRTRRHSARGSCGESLALKYGRVSSVLSDQGIAARNSFATTP